MADLDVSQLITVSQAIAVIDAVQVAQPCECGGYAREVQRRWDRAELDRADRTD